MKQGLLSGDEIISQAAMLAKVETVPHFQACPAAELLAKVHKCDIYDVESQSSAVTAAAISCLAEKRTLLPLGGISSIDSFRNVSSLRAPVVAAQISHDPFALRDLGWLIFLPSTNQEALDMLIQAYMISEDRKVLLPSVVSMDMNLREIVTLPSDQTVANMMPKLKLPRKLSIKEKNAFDVQSRDEEQIQKAMENALKLLQKSGEKWKERFKRHYPLVEKFMLEDAEYAFVVAGYNAETARSAVRKLRQQGEKVGMLRLRLLRPWPAEEISKCISHVKKLAVIDKLSAGSTGILHSDLRANHASAFSAPKRLSEKDFIEILSRLKKEVKPEVLLT